MFDVDRLREGMEVNCSLRIVHNGVKYTQCGNESGYSVSLVILIG